MDMAVCALMARTGLPLIFLNLHITSTSIVFSEEDHAEEA